MSMRVSMGKPHNCVRCYDFPNSLLKHFSYIMILPFHSLSRHNDGQERNVSDITKAPISEEFQVNEKVFAWNRGALYEARVLRRKEEDDELGYYVHCAGYKKSHNRWLTSNEMMKTTPSNRQFYCESRGMQTEDEDEPPKDQHCDIDLLTVSSSHGNE